MSGSGGGVRMPGSSATPVIATSMRHSVLEPHTLLWHQAYQALSTSTAQSAYVNRIRDDFVELT